MNRSKINIETEDGSEMECEVLAVFPYNGNEYIALVPPSEDEDGSTGVLIYLYEENDEGVILSNPDCEINQELLDTLNDYMIANYKPLLNIVSGLMGAGKTTLIRKLVNEAFDEEAVIVAENCVTDDCSDGFTIDVTEETDKVTYCKITGNLCKAISHLADENKPDRIIVEANSDELLSDVLACLEPSVEDGIIDFECSLTVVDAVAYSEQRRDNACVLTNDIIKADAVILSRSQLAEESELEKIADDVSELNENAPFIVTDWSYIDGAAMVMKISEAFEEADCCDDDCCDDDCCDHDNDCTCGHCH